jgi:hypothetical protein
MRPMHSGVLIMFSADDHAGQAPTRPAPDGAKNGLK